VSSAPPASPSGQTPSPDAGSPDALARKTAEALYAREGVVAALGIDLIEVRQGYARLEMTVRPMMLNGHLTAHGGMVFSLADTAFAYACNSRNVATVAAQASIVFLEPAREGEVLVAEARELASSGRTGVYLVDIATRDGRSIASFQGLARAVGGPVIPPQENDIG
jgi:acyl-CoA thioesterase